MASVLLYKFMLCFMNAFVLNFEISGGRSLFIIKLRFKNVSSKVLGSMASVLFYKFLLCFKNAFVLNFENSGGHSFFIIKLRFKNVYRLKFWDQW